MYIILVDNVYDEIVSQSFRIVKTKLEALYWFQYERSYILLEFADTEDKEDANKIISQKGYTVTDTESLYKAYLSDEDYKSVEIYKIEEFDN